ncbi:hypothetical protein GEMRC1_000228 [Eukaryota sp. GEM-RC1]
MKNASSITPFLDQHVAMRLLDHLVSRNAYPLEDILLSKLDIAVSETNITAIRQSLIELAKLNVPSPIALKHHSVSFSLSGDNLNFSIGDKSDSDLSDDVSVRIETLLIDLNLSENDIPNEKPLAEALSPSDLSSYLSKYTEVLELSRLYYSQFKYDHASYLLSPLVSSSPSSDALWAAFDLAILNNNFSLATDLALNVKETIETEAIRNTAGNNFLLRATFLHRALPLILKDPLFLYEHLFRQFKDNKYLGAIANICPHFVRYVFASFCLAGVHEVHEKSRDLHRLLINCITGPDSELLLNDNVIKFFKYLYECNFLSVLDMMPLLKHDIFSDFFFSENAEQIYNCCMFLSVDLMSRTLETLEVQELAKKFAVEISLVEKILVDVVTARGVPGKMTEEECRFEVTCDGDFSSKVFAIAGMDSMV